jgi:hypothetical protein
LKAGGPNSGSPGDCEISHESQEKEATMNKDTAIPGALSNVIRINDDRINEGEGSRAQEKRMGEISTAHMGIL